MSNPRLRALHIPGALLLCLVFGKVALGQETPTSQVTEGFVNAPVATVWQIFTTSEGYRTTGVDQAAVDLRLGGTIASRRGMTGTLGDAETRVDEILSYEPQRMRTVRNRQMPSSDPQRDAVPGTWTVIHFTPSGDDMTHVRIVVLGFRDTPASQALRKATGEANRAMLDHVAQRYWPKCKLCAAPDSDQQ
jgi:uncharacterized protein YndB with AHSA1/START domain